MKIGFVGLGQMGSGIAANLLKAGHELSVYNRSANKAEALVAQGATLAKTPAAAAQGDVVFTMLADDSAVEAAVFGENGILGALKKGAIHASCTTISVKFSEKLTEAHAKSGQRYIAAPVFGRPDAAAAAKLFVVAAGEAQTLKEVAPLFDAIGQRTYVIGDKPSSANLVKLSGNFLLASVIESLGEAMALVSKGGIDRHVYLDLLTSSLFTAPVYKTYGTLIADQSGVKRSFSMEEQKTKEQAQQTHPISIAEALNASMKTMSSLVAKYTAAVQAAATPPNGEARSGTEGPGQRK